MSGSVNGRSVGGSPDATSSHALLAAPGGHTAGHGHVARARDGAAAAMDMPPSPQAAALASALSAQPAAAARAASDGQAAQAPARGLPAELVPRFRAQLREQLSPVPSLLRDLLGPVGGAPLTLHQQVLRLRALAGEAGTVAVQQALESYDASLADPLDAITPAGHDSARRKLMDLFDKACELKELLERPTCGPVPDRKDALDSAIALSRHCLYIELPRLSALVSRRQVEASTLELLAPELPACLSAGASEFSAHETSIIEQRAPLHCTPSSEAGAFDIGLNDLVMDLRGHGVPMHESRIVHVLQLCAAALPEPVGHLDCPLMSGEWLTALITAAAEVSVSSLAVRPPPYNIDARPLIQTAQGRHGNRPFPLTVIGGAAHVPLRIRFPEGMRFRIEQTEPDRMLYMQAGSKAPECHGFGLRIFEFPAPAIPHDDRCCVTQ